MMRYRADLLITHNRNLGASNYFYATAKDFVDADKHPVRITAEILVG